MTGGICMKINRHIHVDIHAHILNTFYLHAPASEDFRFFIPLSGSITLILPDESVPCILPHHGVILIAPEKEFSCISVDTDSLLCISVNRSFISTIEEDGRSILCNSVKDSDNPYYPTLIDILIRIGSAYITNQDETLILSLLLELLEQLSQRFTHTAALSARFSNTSAESRAQKLYDFLEANYGQPLSLSGLASTFFLTPQYLSQFIRKNFGKTFSTLLREIRLEHAVFDIENTNRSITDIALTNGFPGISSMEKAFRAKYGMPPAVYRTRKKTEGKNPDAVSAQITWQNIASQPVSMNLTLSSDELTPFQKNWQDTINIGPLSNMLKDSFFLGLETYGDRLPFRCFRCFNLFTEELVRINPRNGALDFSNLDLAVESARQRNISLFVDFTYNHDHGDPAGQHDLSQNPHILNAVLRHLINSYGLPYMNTWHFELSVLRRPGEYSLEKASDYAARFRYYQSHLHQFLPEVQLGGPQFPMFFGIHELQNLLDGLSQEMISFGFFSFFGYLYEHTPTVSIKETLMSPRRDCLFLQLKACLETIRKYPLYRNIPVRLTDIGSMLFGSAYPVQSCFQSAFLCYNVLNLRSLCDQIIYSTLIDTRRMSSFISPSHEQSALIAANGIQMPVFHSFQMLRRLGSYLCSSGRNYCFTRNSGQSFQLLVYNYAHFSPAFCMSPDRHLKIEETYSVFNEEENETWNIRISGLPSGRYKVTEYILNRANGSVLDKYLRIMESSGINSEDLEKAIMNLRNDEISYYRETSVPRQNISFMQADPDLHLHFHLRPHEIREWVFTHIL